MYLYGCVCVRMSVCVVCVCECMYYLVYGKVHNIIQEKI